MADTSQLVIDSTAVNVRAVTLLIFSPNIPEHCGHPGWIYGHGIGLGDGVHCGWCHVLHRVTGSLETYVTH